MNFNFTGSLSERRINLGSAHEISSSQLAEQARQERAIRQEIRLRHAAATKIQSVVRGRKDAEHQRQAVYLRLQGQEASDFVQATRLVSIATRRRAITTRLGKSRNSSSLTRAEADALTKDDVVLKEWAVRALQVLPDSTPQLLASLHSSIAPSYMILLSSIIETILCHLQYQGAAAQAGYSPYFSILSLLATYTAPVDGLSIGRTAGSDVQTHGWCQWLIGKGLYRSLQAHLQILPISSKGQSKTLSAAVQLILDPLRISSGSDQTARSALLDIIIENILSIPDLPNRTSRSGLTQLVVELPLVEIVERILALPGRLAQGTDSINLLANLLAIGWKRLPHFKKGSQVTSYLRALTLLQDGTPSEILRSSQHAKGVTTDRAMEDRMDEEGASSSRAAQNGHAHAMLSPATMTRLRILPSQEHISAILTASARFPSSTREALCTFLVSTLQSWDAFTCDQVLACITYRHSSNPATSAKTGAVTPHSIEGLVRELWRGWLRGTSLMRFLSSDLLQGRKALVDVLTDEKMKTTWPFLLMLCQLYSRSLLTIGDDEFYPTESNFGDTSKPTASASRNPLSLDEIVAFSGILRNLAFSLYWYEGTGGMLDDLSHYNVVGLKKMDLQSLRNIVTRLLQQLHQRDSRRRYAPKNHWLMSSQLDLNSFIQSVVLEEDELNQYQDESANSSSTDMEVDDLSVDSDDFIPTSRPIISARIASRRGTNMRAGGYSARNLAYLSPRLGVLNNIPFVIPFEVRVEIFHQFTARDYYRMKRHVRPPTQREFTIRRSHIAEDGFTKLNGLGPQLKHKFVIQFIDQFGLEESGIDGGGLFKEFLTSLIKEAFDTDRGLWSATAEQQLYPNPHSYAQMEDSLQWYKFLGRILGKAMYHGILVDVNFASFFLSKWLGKGNGYLDDLSGLESLDKQVYRNLLWLKHYTGDMEKDLTLDFTVTDEEFEVKHIHELVPNGRDIAVTRENRLEYIYRVSHYRLNEQIRLQSEAFLSGLTDIIDLRWLRMLDREELRILISGSEGEINLDDLRKNTVLGGYHEKDEAIEFFWRALESFTHQQRKAFLKFVTSCPSPPLLGFAQLVPNLGIRHAGDDTTRLPTSSTCVNLLKLPRYTSYEQCRKKLLYAIESGAGFDLS